MQKSKLLAALQGEIHRHDFAHFVDEPPSGCARWARRCCSGLPALQEEATDYESVHGASCERSVAGSPESFPLSMMRVDV